MASRPAPTPPPSTPQQVTSQQVTSQHVDPPPLARQLDLQPHPEGGWYRRTWRSTVPVSPPGYDGPRAAATAIYYLLHPGERSRWHVVRPDELWLWHRGGPLELRLGGSGDEPVEDRVILLGADLDAGQQPQARVPGGVWQSATAVSEPVLVSCVVVPGFEWEDFRLFDGDPVRPSSPDGPSQPSTPTR